MKEPTFNALTGEQANIVKAKLKKQGNLQFRYNDANITLLKALFAANGYSWDGYFSLAPGESISEGFCTTSKPIAIKLISDKVTKHYLMHIDSENLQIKTNDGKENPLLVDASEAWVKSQAKVFGQEFIDKLSEVWQQRYIDAKNQAEQAEKMLAALAKIASDQNYVITDLKYR